MHSCQLLKKTFLFHMILFISELKFRHTYSEQCVVLFYGAMGTLGIYHTESYLN